MTPFDREDIYRLASNLDDVMDFVEAAADLVVLTGLGTLPAEMHQQVELLQRAAQTTAEAMPRLRSLKGLSDYWIEVNRIENEADKLYRRLLSRLYSGEFDALEILKLKEVADQLEEAADAFEHVANVVETISVKVLTPHGCGLHRSGRHHPGGPGVRLHQLHDAANSIAVAVSTKALTPRVALALAAVMNLVGALISTSVAKTVGAGIIDTPEGSDGLQIVFAALIGAITWNLITWWYGLPSSSSHALIGGLVGAALAAAHRCSGWGPRQGHHPDGDLAAGRFRARLPVHARLLWAFRNANVSKANRGFRYAQIVSSGTMALGHGMQDAQKTMGIITLALFTAGEIDTFEVPFWVVLAARPRSAPARTRVASASCDAGTADHPADAGRWVRRADRGLGRHGDDRDRLRRPGVDDAHHDDLDHGRRRDRRLSAVRWGVAGNIVVAWVVTLPAAGAVAAVAYFLTHAIVG